MGNKNKGGKLQRKNQPYKLLVSGDATATAVAIGGANGSNAANNKTTLDIQLVQIDLGVAAQVGVGSKVKLRLRGSVYEADFDNQRLGVVPGHYNDLLLPQREYAGQLVRVAIYGDPIIIVRVNIKSLGNE